MLKGSQLGLEGCLGWEMQSSLPFFKIGGLSIFTLAVISLIVMYFRKQIFLINMFYGTYILGIICITIPLILFGFGKFCTVALIFYIFDLFILPVLTFVLLTYTYRNIKKEREVNLDIKARHEIEKILSLRDPRISIILVWIIILFNTFIYNIWE